MLHTPFTLTVLYWCDNTLQLKYTMHYIRTHVTPLLTEYRTLIRDAFFDINTFLDAQLESERTAQLIVAGIVATPFVGGFVFVLLLMASF